MSLVYPIFRRGNILYRKGRIITLLSYNRFLLHFDSISLIYLTPTGFKISQTEAKLYK